MESPAERSRERIRRNGPIPFAAFMEEALYGESGYYNRPEPAIGRAGDFVTGSSFSGLFGRTTARLLERLDGQLGAPARFLEVAYGEGSHLAAVRAAAGPDRELFGWDRIERPLPADVRRLVSLDELQQPIEGLIFSYELFDALPIHRFVGLEDGSVGELWVDLGTSDSFVWRPGAISDPALQALLGGHRLEVGQIADLSADWATLYTRLAAALGRGLLVTFDYGYERDRLLDRRVRRHGTLACYRQHRVHRDALSNAGEQDLTAHVDFTALREAGETAGLSTIAFTRQARWLTALGLFDDLQGSDQATRLDAATLLDGEGMGEEIRVLVQARGIDAADSMGLELL